MLHVRKLATDPVCSPSKQAALAAAPSASRKRSAAAAAAVPAPDSLDVSALAFGSRVCGYVKAVGSKVGLGVREFRLQELWVVVLVGSGDFFSGHVPPALQQTVIIGVPSGGMRGNVKAPAIGNGGRVQGSSWPKVGLRLCG